MSKDKYFRDELAFLREQGRVFSETYPQLSRFLNESATDPDVERLQDGFAFLTSKLREKIEDEFPEFTHSMVSMLWPNYLRPLPSMTIVQFTPYPHRFEKQVVAKGAVLNSTEIQGTVCHFRTCRDVNIYPIQCEHVVAANTHETSYIDLHLTLLQKPHHSLFLSQMMLEQSDQSAADHVVLEDLRFYLGGQHYPAQMLYLWLNHYLDKIELIQGENITCLPAHSLRAVGFRSEEAILPYPKNAYEGYRLIQEYLSFEPAFLFVDILNLHTIPHAIGEHGITLRFSFTRRLPKDVRVTADNFGLFCVPAINLFSHDAEPIHLNGKKTEYLLHTSSRYARHYDVFSIDEVTGMLNDQNSCTLHTNRHYTPFESFHHEIARANNQQAFYFRTRIHHHPRYKGFYHLLSFVRSDESQCLNRSETISLKLTCTNRLLPLQLGKGDICIQMGSTLNAMSCQNITEPTPPLYPILDGTLFWSLASNLSLNYLSLLSRDALGSILRIYDFKALVDRQVESISRQRIDGIVNIESHPIDRMVNGLPIKGLQSIITLSQSCFGSEGELYLFGTVLSQFFSLYASINSFHELVVINAENKERYTWKTQTGLQSQV